MTLILKQTDRNCTHISQISSFEEAVTQLNCDEALLFDVDDEDCVSADCLLQKLDELEMEDKYVDLFQLIDAVMDKHSRCGEE